MNLSTGVDIIEIQRIAEAIKRHGEGFLKRIYTPRELEICIRTRMNADERGKLTTKSAEISENLRPPKGHCAENEFCAYSIPSLAARFAAKEAVAKALGCGIGEVRWQEIEILRDDARAPVLYLHGAAETLAAALGLTTWSLSISHTQSQAVAFVVALGK